MKMVAITSNDDIKGNEEAMVKSSHDAEFP